MRPRAVRMFSMQDCIVTTHKTFVLRKKVQSVVLRFYVLVFQRADRPNQLLLCRHHST